MFRFSHITHEVGQKSEPAIIDVTQMFRATDLLVGDTQDSFREDLTKLVPPLIFRRAKARAETFRSAVI